MSKINNGFIVRIKDKANRATSFAPELYDFLRFHGSHHTKLGRFSNFAIKLAYKMARFIKNKKRQTVLAAQGIASEKEKSRNSIKFPWLLPLTEVSADKGRKVLIIAETSMAQCTKYRVTQKVDMLEYLGFEVTVCDWRESNNVRQFLQVHGLVIYYRVPAFDSVKDLLAESQRLNLETFFDVDDLIFDIEEFKKNSNIDSLSDKERKGALEGVELYRYTLEHCKHAIASTPTIAEFMRKYSKGEVYVIENCLDKQMFKLEEKVQVANLSKDHNFVTIGYGSGTTTHDADFDICSTALLKILKVYPHVRLAIHGHLKLSDAFDSVSVQILRVPFLKADEYYTALSTFDINLAPLEPSVFNDAKSNIKFVEASIFAVPTVASPAAAFSQVVNHGENGFLCDTDEQWYEVLSSLVESKDRRNNIGKNAKVTVTEAYHFEHVAKYQFSPLLKKHLPERKNKRRVLVANILFRPTAFGGATLVTEQLAKRVQAVPDSEVAIFTGFWDDGGADVPHQQMIRYETLGMQVFAVRFPMVNTPELEYKNGDIEASFYDAIKAFKPDVVHFHSIQQLGASLADPCKKLHVPYVITLHDAWWLCERQFMVKDNGKFCGQCSVDPRVCSNSCTPDSAHTYSRYFYLREVLQNADLLLCPSEYQRNLYLSNGLAPEKVLVNKNGVLPPKLEILKTKSDKLRFAYLGGNAPHKGYGWLKEIFESIDSDNFSLELTDIQRALGAPSIHDKDWNIQGELVISGGFDSEGIDEFFSNVDVLLQPSQCKESFGLTIREALIRDTWVITTDSGATGEDVIEGVNGNVVGMDDQEGFKAAVMSRIESTEPYNNPHKNDIRLYATQAEELSTYFDKVIK